MLVVSFFLLFEFSVFFVFFGFQFILLHLLFFECLRACLRVGLSLFFAVSLCMLFFSLC